MLHPRSLAFIAVVGVIPAHAPSIWDTCGGIQGGRHSVCAAQPGTGGFHTFGTQSQGPSVATTIWNDHNHGPSHATVRGFIAVHFHSWGWCGFPRWNNGMQTHQKHQNTARPLPTCLAAVPLHHPSTPLLCTVTSVPLLHAVPLYHYSPPILQTMTPYCDPMPVLYTVTLSRCPVPFSGMDTRRPTNDSEK